MTVKLYRITCGSIVLLIVDLIWVLSSELTEYLYKDKNYNKPFFSTYVKTSLFTIYLLGFILCKSWRQQCYQLFQSVRLTDVPDLSNGPNSCQQTSSCGNRSMPMYSVLNQNGDQSLEDSIEDNTLDAKSECNEEEQVLSEPVWVPIKFGTSDISSVNSEKSSGTESDSERCHNYNLRSSRSRKVNGHQKSVRLLKVN